MTKQIENVNKHNSNYDSELIYHVPLINIKINPQKRVRKLKKFYKTDLEYIGLREALREFGQIAPIELDTNLVLVTGFRRFLAATELSWTTIDATIKEYTEEERLDHEISENINRKAFTDYETYIAIAKRKRLYEKKHPETIRGKYNRQKIDKMLKNETISFMDRRTESFTERYSRIYGMTRRALEYKVQIGEAFLDEKFSKRIEELVIKKKVTQARLLSILRKNKIQKHVDTIREKQDIRTKKKDLMKQKIQLESNIRKSIVQIFDETGNIVASKNSKLKELRKPKEVDGHPKEFIDNKPSEGDYPQERKFTSSSVDNLELNLKTKEFERDKKKNYRIICKVCSSVLELNHSDLRKYAI